MKKRGVFNLLSSLREAGSRAANIVENHNGTITVKSEKGRGTNFIIHLPENIKA